MADLYLFNKPFGILSQFTELDGSPGLADFIKIKNIYPAGRLDKDSEGLLLLTNNGNLQHKISDPKHKMEKTYWVQVEGIPNETALNLLRKGVKLKDGITLPAKVRLLNKDKLKSLLWERIPPIRYRANIPTQWVEIKIKQGKNRQIRRMTAAVGFPTLRLIRYAIGNWNVENINLGQYKQINV